MKKFNNMRESTCRFSHVIALIITIFFGILCLYFTSKNKYPKQQEVVEDCDFYEDLKAVYPAAEKSPDND